MNTNPHSISPSVTKIIQDEILELEKALKYHHNMASQIEAALRERKSRLDNIEKVKGKKK